MRNIVTWVAGVSVQSHSLHVCEGNAKAFLKNNSAFYKFKSIWIY